MTTPTAEEWMPSTPEGKMIVDAIKADVVAAYDKGYQDGLAAERERNSAAVEALEEIAGGNGTGGIDCSMAVHFCKMNTTTTPTAEEWTQEGTSVLIGIDEHDNRYYFHCTQEWSSKIAVASHNASIAAEREKHDKLEALYRLLLKDSNEQDARLAASVEALKRAQTQANGNITGCGTCATIRVELGIALAKLGEGK